MRRLADAGLTTREACGNSVRNITACPYAGVAADELFDVTPYAEALTRYLLRHPLSSTLPRKFKIAFEGCADRSHRHSASTTSASARSLGAGRRRAASASPPAAARRSWRPPAGAAPRVPAGVGDPPRRRSGAAGLPAARRLQAQAAQPDEVPDQDARLDALARGVRARADARAGCAATCRRSRSIRRRRGAARLGQGLVAVGRPHRGARARPAGSPAPASRRRSSPVFRPATTRYARWRATNVRPQKQFGYVMAIAAGAARRPDERADARARRTGARVRRRHGPRHAGSEPACSAGCNACDVRQLYRAPGRGRPRPRPTPARSPT